MTKNGKREYQRIDPELLRDFIHSKDVWMRRAIVAVMMLAGNEVPDYLDAEHQWINEEIEKRTKESR